MYSRSTGEWTRKEDVPYVTWSSMCAVVRNKGKLEFVVAGGYTYSDGVFDDVAIFDVEDNVWRRAQNRLPLPLYSGIALQFEDTFLVRIYNCQIFLFVNSPPRQSKWGRFWIATDHCYCSYKNRDSCREVSQGNLQVWGRDGAVDEASGGNSEWPIWDSGLGQPGSLPWVLKSSRQHCCCLLHLSEICLGVSAD